ncbi:MAG TPA: DUF2079 domain-containing protein [Leptospiraceae bacterium]|nr:DUF2079 domain-containing protein [Leptospiraceae bacterium]HMX32653.1 DUF2079 domain-containing protein [Leptospiraceae bacterium]HMY30368.1 DUF2079 domain-containing protein [Leptospiraceae bacterium]HMZ65882.1 DUF2079 domain-containing protein [Leptospiraceae bacterium]HNA07099.1 DUF2079 domain-containing protein [Leptospiraceae bacterium]
MSFYFILKARKKSVELEKNSNSKLEFFFALGLIFFYSLLFLYTFYQFKNSFFLVDFDYLALAEILNNSLSGKFFTTHHYGNNVTGNYLAHHFSPSLLLLSPFLFLSDTRLGYGYGLLFYTLLSLGLMGFLLYKFKLRGSVFFFSFLSLSINIYLYRLFFAYHFELLIVFFFLLFFLGREINSKGLLFISILFLLLLKEDMAIYVSCLSLYFFLLRDWKTGGLLLLASLFYFFYIPSFFRNYIDISTQVNWLEDWSKWGNTYSEIFFNILLNPISIFKLFLDKWKVLKEFIFSFSPFVFLEWKLIIVSIPIFIIHFISDRIWYNSFYNYYSYTVISFWIVAFLISIKKMNESKWRQYLPGLLLLSLSISLYTNSDDQLFPYTRFQIDKTRLENIQTIVNFIPEKNSVATQFDLGAFVKRENPLFPLHEKNLDKDYILIDREKGITPYVDRKRIETMIISMEGKYSLIAKYDGIELYKKINTDKPR